MKWLKIVLWLLFPVTITAILIFLKTKNAKKMSVSDQKVTRGIRNKNPFNIRKSTNQWKGKIEGTDKEFETFSEMVYGVRACIKLLETYRNQGYKTIGQIINRFAPPIENDTNSYLSYVVQKSGFTASSEINSPESEYKVLSAMAKLESGFVLTKKMYDDAKKMV